MEKKEKKEVKASMGEFEADRYELKRNARTALKAIKAENKHKKFIKVKTVKGYFEVEESKYLRNKQYYDNL